MSQQTYYFRIGLFVLIGIALLCMALVIFGGKALFQKKGALFETVFNESVQGLDVGSPVKIRGVTIGQVEKIEFVNMAYPSSNSYIRVVMREAFTMDQKARNTHKTAFDLLQHEIANGLRLKQASAGITGGIYLEADYVTQHKDLPLDFTPQYPYWPSQPSLMSVLGKAVENFLLKMEKTPFDELVIDLDQTVKSLNELVNTAIPAVHDAQQALSNVRVALTTLTDTVNAALKEDIRPTLANVNKASASLPIVMEEAENVIREADSILMGAQAWSDELRGNLNEVVISLREFLENVKIHPAGTLLGDPPPKSGIMQ